jgi:hypothetical protein
LGGDYTFNKFGQLLALDGTIHQTSCIDTSKQNGVAEKKHKHIVETASSLLLSAFISNEFWREVVLTVVSLINTIPTSHSSGLSPFEKLYGYVPNYSSFRVFGCTCFVLRPYMEHSKLSSRSAIYVFQVVVKVKKGIDVLIQQLRNFICLVMLSFSSIYLFFSISSTTHSLTKPDLIRIDPFSDDSNMHTSLHV